LDLYHCLALFLISATTPAEGEPQSIHSWCLDASTCMQKHSAQQPAYGPL